MAELLTGRNTITPLRLGRVLAVDALHHCSAGCLRSDDCWQLTLGRQLNHQMEESLMKSLAMLNGDQMPILGLFASKDRIVPVPTVMAFGVLADVDTGYPLLLSPRKLSGIFFCL